MAKKKAIIIKPVPALLATKRITGRSKVVAAAAQKEAARAEDKEEEEEYEDKEADETEEAGEEQAAASEHEEESKDEARLQPATKKRRTAAPAANKSMAEKRPRASNLLKRKAGTTTAARYVASTSKSLSPSSSSSAVSVPQQPAKTPKPKPGTKIVKGLTDCVFIALPSLDDIIAYNTIDNKLKTRGQDQLKDSAAWEKMIEFHYKTLGEEPPVKDLDNAPWRTNLSLLASAKVRMAPFNTPYKWTQVVNEENILEGREAAGFHTPPFSKAMRRLMGRRRRS